jgi:hypothetical protein
MIIGVAQEEPEMLESFRSNFLAARRAEAVQILQRGVRRGELRGEVFFRSRSRRALRTALLPSAD